MPVTNAQAISFLEKSPKAANIPAIKMVKITANGINCPCQKPLANPAMNCVMPSPIRKVYLPPLK